MEFPTRRADSSDSSDLPLFDVEGEEILIDRDALWCDVRYSSLRRVGVPRSMEGLQLYRKSERCDISLVAAEGGKIREKISPSWMKEDGNLGKKAF
jgi:hypothetical protein